MKKWEKAEISCVNISATEHQFRFNWELDGGYLGDGKLTGWFGPDPKCGSEPANTGATTEPATSEPATEATDALS